MDNDHIVRALNDLLRVDIDAIRAYSQALDACKDGETVRMLTQFRGDHERHVSELGNLVRNYGGTPAHNPDLKGFLLEGMTAIRSLAGEEQALKAMRQNEVVTNRAYDNALNQQLPEDCRNLILRNREDERRHLAWIEARVKRPVTV